MLLCLVLSYSRVGDNTRFFGMFFGLFIWCVFITYFYIFLFVYRWVRWAFQVVFSVSVLS